jgi:hypothetical protein
METTHTTGSTSTTGSANSVRKPRWAIPLGVLTLSAAALGVFATPALASEPSGSRVLECRSGIVTQGDVQMSAATATRVPAAQLPDTTPGDCSLR